MNIEPDKTRNSAHCTEISYWEQKESSGMWCKHSFIVANEDTELYEGHCGLNFFFTKQAITDNQ